MEQSIRESREHLGQIIQRWANVMNVEHFLAGVEMRASEKSSDERDKVLERLELAREFLGTQDPLDFFLAWKTPSELYRPRDAALTPFLKMTRMMTKISSRIAAYRPRTCETPFIVLRA